MSSSLKLVRQYELLEEDELKFLLKKEQRERRQFYRAVYVIMILCFTIPFFAAWVRAVTASYLSWRYFLRRVQRDISHGTKTIERVHITRKLFMPQTSSYFFYLDSPTKLSIEVGDKDYHKMREGDEVNIEYTTYAQIYLGYF